MGHGASKQEPGMEMRPGMKLIQLKIEQVKRRVRRKSSIVSTAELLRPEEREGMVDDDSARGATAMTEKEEEGARSPETIADADADAASEEKVKEEKRIDEEENVATEAAKEEEGKRVLGFSGPDEDEEEDDDERGRELRCLTADADLPESPSFRFYCLQLARDSEDEDPVKFGDGGRKDQLPKTKEKEKNVAHENDDDTDSENRWLDLTSISSNGHIAQVNFFLFLSECILSLSIVDLIDGNVSGKGMPWCNKSYIDTGTILESMRAQRAQDCAPITKTTRNVKR
ncbi:hypothetical protein COCNU_scaffold011937G000030 [Cocos nucifera]|nr:hypothetical protein [Cocos nucifera]